MKMPLAIVGVLLEDDPDLDADEYMATPIAGLDRRIRITYSQTTPEDAENGENSESGWIDEEGVEMDPDGWDIEDGISAVDKAVKFLKSEGAYYASNSRFSPKTWYFTGYHTIDYATGTDEERRFHLANYAKEEEEEIFNQMTQRRAY